MRARIHFLVKDLIDELESEQIQLGTGAYLRVQELLRLIPEDISDADLLLALAPVLTRSGREQELVYEKFTLCQRRAEEVFGPQPTGDLQELKPIDLIEQKTKNSKRWTWANTALIIILLASLLWQCLRRPRIIEKSFEVNSGQVFSICPNAIPELDSFGCKITHFALKFMQNAAPDTARTLPRGSVMIGSSSFANYYVQNDTCLFVTSRDSVKAVDSLVLNVVFQNQKTAELRLRIFIDLKIGKPPNSNLTLFWYLFFAQVLSIVFYLLWPYLKWQRRKLYAQPDRKDKPPYVWNVKIPGIEEVLLDDTYHYALRVMRRRSHRGVPRRLDMERTIAATVERGGSPKFQYLPMSQPIDYLLLLERLQTGNHRMKLFDAFYRAFKAHELSIERFFYDSDLLICFNEAHPDGIHLDELAYRFAGARLVLVGSGLQLIHPLRSSLIAWTDIFEHWPQRLLLTPRHPDEWSRNEILLGSLFQVLPATLQSLGFWVEELEQNEGAHFYHRQEFLKDLPNPVFQPDKAYPLASLLLQFPHELVCWVATCAIYPSLHWDLTLWLGQQLEARFNTTLIEHYTLLRLFRIRWFVEGQMPKTAREQLLEWLEGEDSTLLAALRHDLAMVLEQSPPPEDSIAWADHRLQLVFNRWMSETNRNNKKKHKRELAQLMHQADADFVALKYLDMPPTLLHFEVPLTLKKYVLQEYWRAFSIFIRTNKGDSIRKKETVKSPPSVKDNSILNSNLSAFPEMVFVKGDTFQMGNNDYSTENPIHFVTLDDFYLGKYPVTQKQWHYIMGNDPTYFKNCGDCPVEQVSWDDVQDFLEKLNAKFPGKNYRLPSEAEWEYAARGGNQSKGYTYAGSNNLEDVAWCDSNSGSKTHPVGGKQANELGIFDMSGNVWEWCFDWYGQYVSGDQMNPQGISYGSNRVLRGGSWYDGSTVCRVSLRGNDSPVARHINCGFRLASSPQ